LTDSAIENITYYIYINNINNFLYSIIEIIFLNVSKIYTKNKKTRMTSTLLFYIIPVLM